MLVQSGAGREKLVRTRPRLCRDQSLTQKIAGSSDDKVGKPALFEFEECLEPSFIIEEHEGGRCTILVPSIPTFAVQSSLRTGNGFILGTFLSLTLSEPFPNGDRVPRIWLQSWMEK
jgi:hypothetical protein